MLQCLIYQAVHSVTRLGHFCKVLVTNFLEKVAQKIGKIFKAFWRACLFNLKLL